MKTFIAVLSLLIIAGCADRQPVAATQQQATAPTVAAITQPLAPTPTAQPKQEPDLTRDQARAVLISSAPFNAQLSRWGWQRQFLGVDGIVKRDDVTREVLCRWHFVFSGDGWPAKAAATMTAYQPTSVAIFTRFDDGWRLTALSNLEGEEGMLPGVPTAQSELIGVSVDRAKKQHPEDPYATPGKS